MMSRMKRSSSPLVSSVPATSTTGRPGRAGTAAPAWRSAGRVFDPRNAGRERARRGLDARDGTGCDHRVGSVGFEM